MKKIYILSLLVLSTFSVGATIHNVSVASNSFSPNGISSVMVGDTIRWTLTAGSHTTTSVSVPAGAATWNHTFSGINDVFDYKVTVAGNYGYMCAFHSGMVGGFVAGTNNTEEIENVASLKAYPNPFKGKITIPNKSATTIDIINVLGEKVRSINVGTNEKTSVLDLSELKKGIYFYVLKDENVVLETRRIVKTD